MIGPSPWVLINMGARYVSCMHNVAGIQDSDIEIFWGCPNTTDLNVQVCTLGELCGFSGFQNPFPNPVVDSPLGLSQKPEPNQWFRFIIPMFLHAGIIHIGFNMLLQLTMAREMEIAIGPIRFFLVYICSGIFGFVLGGNFAATGIASTGCSGSLFGILALTLLDLLYNWRDRPKPWRDLAFIALDVVVSFVLGLLPGLDNFSHIGGFFMGLVLGICILRSPNAIRKRTNYDDPPYSAVSRRSDDQNGGMASFFKHPLAFFQGRRLAWWAWWLARAASLVFVFVVFIVLLNNFYIYRKTCSWCKYLSCLVSLPYALSNVR
jgi:membrane associated rhomboid family serine protease